MVFLGEIRYLFALGCSKSIKIAVYLLVHARVYSLQSYTQYKHKQQINIKL